MSFIKDLYKDEIRDGFLVTANRKKLWNVQIGLMLEFKRICEKYKLRYFADAGTLLGAVRHKGFIPWDDDVDFGMPRPDYEKFKQIAPHEIHEPYFFDNWYCHDEQSPTDVSFFGTFSKLRDSRTSMIEWAWATDMNQGMWIDIFPYDSAPPFEDKLDEANFYARVELLMAILETERLNKMIEEHRPLPLSFENINQFLNLPIKERKFHFERISNEIFKETGYWINSQNVETHRFQKSFKASSFDEVIDLPFESITLPAPKDYDNVLTAYYGDWRTPIVGWFYGHTMFYSADIPSKDYLKNGKFPPRQGGGVIGLDIGVLSAA